MANRLKRPTNPYDPSWVEYAAQNPGLRRSLSASDPGDPPPSDPPPAPDLSFLPDQFKAEDGTYKTDEVKTRFDELVSFKSQTEEALAALPKEPSEYAMKAPEGHTFPEGFDPSKFAQPVLDDKGEPVIENGQPKTRPFDLNDMIDASDPDLPLLQAAMHKHGAKPELMSELASILGNREIRGLMQADQTARAELKALGPDGQSRIDTVNRTLSAKLPEAQAKAVADTITSADALRGIEALIKSSTAPVIPAHQTKPDLDTLSNKELIALGMKQQTG